MRSLMNHVLLLGNQGAAVPTPWYRAAGAPAPVAIYQPAGAASFEASLINLAQPGFHDAVYGGVPPSWTTEGGWQFNGSTQYLITDIVPLVNSTWSMIIEFSDVVGTGGILAGSGDVVNSHQLSIQPNRSDNTVGYWNGLYILISPGLTAGNLAVAGNKGYRNGVVEAGEMTTGSAVQPVMYIGAYNKGGIQAPIAAKIKAIAVYDQVLTAPQVEAIYTAMQSLPTLPTPSGHTHLFAMPGTKDQHQIEACNGKLYAIGGESLGRNPKALYEYDPTAGTWATKAALPIAEAERQSAGWKAVNGKLYFIGGFTSGAGTMHASVYEYDPATDTWDTEKTDMPTPREDFGTCVIDDKIHVFGGITTGTTPTAVHEVYDPATDTWETKEPMPAPKLLGNFGAAAGGKAYAIGGTNTMTGYPDLFPVTTVYEYDPLTDTWATKEPIPVSACYREVAELGGKLYVCGGATAGFYTPDVTTIYEYDPANDTWATAGSMPYAVSGSALTVYGGAIYLSGGYNGSKYLREFWRLDVG